MKIETTNQGLAELAHALDAVCDTCVHRWGYDTGNKRDICAQCRLSNFYPIRYKKKSEN